MAAAVEVVGAVGLGIVAGTVARRALRWADVHREIGSAERSLYTLVLAAFVLGASDLLEVDGLLAVFVAGLAHNRATPEVDRRDEVAIDEPMSQFLVVPVFVLLGLALPWAMLTSRGSRTRWCGLPAPWWWPPARSSTG